MLTLKRLLEESVIAALSQTRPLPKNIRTKRKQWRSVRQFNMVRIASVNVNGLNNKTERQNTFRWLDKERFDIILIQETHWIHAETENSWNKDWSGDSFWNYGTNLSKGMSVLFNKSHTFNINSVTDFVDGRATSIKLTFNDQNNSNS